MNGSSDIFMFAAVAALIGAGHTLVNPAHYLPFAAIGKSRNWGIGRTLRLVLACGAGHAVSSLSVALVGIFCGAGVGVLSDLDIVRGNFVKWAFFVFAAAYFIVGLYRGFSGAVHLHCDGTACVASDGCNKAPKVGANFSDRTNFWALFLIFTFGPCEVLLPLVMYPAAGGEWLGAFAVAAAFSLATIATMAAAVAALMAGLNVLKFDTSFLARWGTAATGAALLLCSAFAFFSH